MKASGFDMAAGSFASVSASNGSCTLADFTVSGYEAPVWDDDEEDYVGGCPGSFVVCVFIHNERERERFIFRLIEKLLK